ncbi:hypothetical protein SZ55_2977 [Pseudomonas sp. FeS53a]|nr:hypothetical protein SZ55_2977 [Pseudomonas sp. FeS53a]
MKNRHLTLFWRREPQKNRLPRGRPLPSRDDTLRPCKSVCISGGNSSRPVVGSANSGRLSVGLCEVPARGAAGVAGPDQESTL